MYYCYIHDWTSPDYACPYCSGPFDTYHDGFANGVQWAINILKETTNESRAQFFALLLHKEWEKKNEK